jgi:creatinine amidohydrolase
LFARNIAARLFGTFVIFSPSFDSNFMPLANEVGRAVREATGVHPVTQPPGTPWKQPTPTFSLKYYDEPYLDFVGVQSGHNGGHLDWCAHHAILVKAAEEGGGVVYPPVYFHDGFPRQLLVPLLTELFARLKKTGFRVILGVSGHNVQGQIDMINKALAPVVADGTVTGIGLWEITLSQGAESNTDHAAKWETSNMMFLYPDLVDLSALGEGPLALDMKPPDGIGGLDPRRHASAEVGRRNVGLAAQAIARRAKELFEALPTLRDSSQPRVITPGQWWMI